MSVFGDMMEAAHKSETSVDNYFTRQYIPEDNSELHTRSRENLKSHILPLTSALKWRQYVPLDCWYSPTSKHGVTNQKTSSDILIKTFCTLKLFILHSITRSSMYVYPKLKRNMLSE
jgi:hypothetical protein